MLDLLIFLMILFVLVLSHEAGHFFIARAFGVRVEEFGFGLPPKILNFWRDRKGTSYSLNLLPFGGFVKIFGEDLPAEDAASFSNKPAYQRALVLLAGVSANILLAYFLFSLLAGLGVPEAVPDEEKHLYPEAKITILDVAPSSPAFFAGVAAADEVVKIKSAGEEFTPKTIEEMQAFIKRHQGGNIALFLTRQKKPIEISVFSRENPPEGEGPLGLVLGLVSVQKSAWYMAPLDGARMTWAVFKGTVLGFARLAGDWFKGKSVGAEIAGPVGIFSIASSALNFGPIALLMLVAVLSVNLSIINILPFPGLDGGRLFFLFVETFRGRRISPKASAFAHSLGIAILIALMVFVTYRDIVRYAF